MLITNPELLKAFHTDQRIWQGIPSIEVTKQGRVFVTFYSGGVKEEIGNYAMVVCSDDGVHYSEPIAVAYLADHRCYDPCLWIDPLGRLWFTWSVCPDDGLYASICDDPDAFKLHWSEPFLVGHDIMMNKPIVLSSGEWLFPLAVWNHGVRSLPPQYDSKTPEKGSFVYKTSDNGNSFVRLGCADVKKRSFDEHMVVELMDGRLWMLVRTDYGIGQAFSCDRGKTWGPDSDSLLGGPSSRFHITRLRSGRLMLINHVHFTRRNNLTVLLSDDDGKTWPYKLLLDSRMAVSYPDAKEADDGYIYITYDRERGAFKKSLQEAKACAREILVCRITERDILSGAVTDPGSYTHRIVSKLSDYRGVDSNPYGEIRYLTDQEFAESVKGQGEEIIKAVFDAYPIRCTDSNADKQGKLDAMIQEFSEGNYRNSQLLLRIIQFARSLSGEPEPLNPTVERICAWISAHIAENFSLSDIADQLRISLYYMCHLFKRCTGSTILDYRNELRLTMAKQALITTDKKVTDIAAECGFSGDSYFCEVFLSSEGISPTEYRRIHK